MKCVLLFSIYFVIRSASAALLCDICVCSSLFYRDCSNRGLKVLPSPKDLRHGCIIDATGNPLNANLMDVWMKNYAGHISQINLKGTNYQPPVDYMKGVDFILDDITVPNDSLFTANDISQKIEDKSEGVLGLSNWISIFVYVCGALVTGVSLFCLHRKLPVVRAYILNVTQRLEQRDVELARICAEEDLYNPEPVAPPRRNRGRGRGNGHPQRRAENVRSFNIFFDCS